MAKVEHAKPLVGLLVLALLASACKRREISVYWVDRPEVESAETPEGSELPAKVQLPAQPPTTWQPVEITGGPRVASFVVDPVKPGTESGDMAVTVFSGTVGGLLANVNRWRGEVQLPGINADQLPEATERLQSGDHTIHVIDVAGSGRQTLGAILPIEGETWFFKLHGPQMTVTANRAAFRDYLAGVEVVVGPPDQAQATPPPDAPEQPVLRYETKPDSWVEEPANRPRVASFKIAGEAGQSAELAVVALSVSSGARLSIVNMWRSTVGLEAATEDQLPGLVDVIEAGGQQFSIVEFEGDQPVTEAKNKARLIVVFAPVGEHTWYFKLTGDSDLVSEQKPALLEFLRSVEFGTSP